MKIPFKNIEPFVKSPPANMRVILVYGPDTGLVKERAQIIGKSIVEDLNDPFNAVTLSPAILTDDPARLFDEACALSMMGGKRLIRIEDANDKLTILLKDYLENPNENALIGLEAAGLSPRSSLRKFCEAAEEAAALPCYVEDARDLARLIHETAKQANKQIDQDAVMWLATNIAGDRARARSELEKLLLYKGTDDTSNITLGDAQAACGVAGAQNLDDLIYAVGSGQSEKALRIYNQLLEEGVVFMPIIRSLQNHFRRLHATRVRIDSGEPAGVAMKSLAPPIFFKQQGAFEAQTQRWRKTSLERVMSRLMDLEAECKTTGMPVDTICAQAVLGISAMRG